MPARSYADQIWELHKIFKLKRIFKAWSEIKSNIDRFDDSFERVLSLSGQKTTEAKNQRERSSGAKRTLRP